MAEPLTHILRGAQEPFSWGNLDCSLFVADWVKELTGVDPMRGWRGSYNDLRGWLRIKKTLKLGDAAEAALLSIGWSKICPSLAPDGSVGVVILENSDEALSLRFHTKWLVKSLDGLWRVNQAERAWACPLLYR